MTLVDAAELIAPAVAATLDALDLKPEDAAAARLARYYALQIDQATASREPKISAWAARNIGPLLLQTLESLGATPAARAAISGRKPEKPDARPSGLQAIRQARTA